MSVQLADSLDLTETHFVRRGMSKQISDLLLDAINTGRLPQGARINDIELSKELGVSRTPVREALQWLKFVGLIETSANRYTRVITVTDSMLRNALITWGALFASVIDEVAPRLPRTAISAMRKEAKSFTKAVKARDAAQAAAANFEIFRIPTVHSTNPFLKRGIDSVVHIIRLGALSLPDWIDADRLKAVQTDFIDALESGDADGARAALAQAVEMGSQVEVATS